MARIRTIKPEFWTDETLAHCSVMARLLFIATWNFADDHGGLQRSPYQLKAQAFPYDTVDCEPLLQELLGAGLLVEYEADGQKYLHIPGFRKHQKIERRAPPRYPVYPTSTENSRMAPGISLSAPGNSTSPTENSVGTTGISLSPTGNSQMPTGSSSSTRGLLRKGKEGNGTDGKGAGEPSLRDGTLAPCARSPAALELTPDEPEDPPEPEAKPLKAKKGPIPENFTLSDSMREHALRRYPDCDCEQWFELFRHHHLAHGKHMKSWCSAWVTWVGNGEQYGYPKLAKKAEVSRGGLPVINA